MIHPVNGEYYIGSKKLLIVVSLIYCKWLESVGAFMGLPNLAHEALNALIFQVTTSVAEGSFRTMKGLSTCNRRNMDPNTHIGCLLAMVNGDVNNRILEWAK